MAEGHLERLLDQMNIRETRIYLDQSRHPPEDEKGRYMVDKVDKEVEVEVDRREETKGECRIRTALEKVSIFYQRIFQKRRIAHNEK